MRKLTLAGGQYTQDLAEVLRTVRHKGRAASLRNAHKLAVAQSDFYRQQLPCSRHLSTKVNMRAQKAFIHY